MKNVLLALIFLWSGNVLLAQYRIGFRAGVYGFDEEVLFPNGVISWLENDLRPSLSGELFLSKNIGKSSWLWSGSVSYQRFECEAEVEFVYSYQLNGREIPVYTMGMRKEFTNIAGLAIGTGYELLDKNRSQRLIVEFGGRFASSFRTGMRIETEEEVVPDYESYSDNDFSERLISGLYFRPTYQVRIGGRDSPWEFILYMEGNMLWRNKAPITNPIFTYGGGVGLAYTINGGDNFKGRGLK